MWAWWEGFLGEKCIVAQRTLYDVRDGNEYRIRKLADGNCWMTENLDLVLTAGNTLTSYDTDLNNVSSWTPTSSTATTAGEKWGTGTDYFDDSSQTSSDINVEHSYRASSDRTVSTVDDGDQEIGTHYNWYAATATSGTYETVSTEAPNSLCPRGWLLPSKDSYDDLLDKYGVTVDNADDFAIVNARPLSFVFSSQYYWYVGGFRYLGTYGTYWTGTAQYKNVNAYAFVMLNGGDTWLKTQASAKNYGRIIRCVAR